VSFFQQYKMSSAVAGSFLTLVATGAASAAPIRIAPAALVAPASQLSDVRYVGKRHVARRHVARHYRYGRRHHRGGAAFAGVALGLFGAALSAAANDGYYYDDGPYYYPAYGYGYGYAPRYYGGYRGRVYNGGHRWHGQRFGGGPAWHGSARQMGGGRSFGGGRAFVARGGGGGGRHH
jgi:hypothetical protein